MKNKKGKLIVIEGPDGVGKTTLVNEIINDFNFYKFSFPGKECEGTLGSNVYKLHHKMIDKEIIFSEELNTVLQALHVAAHLDLIKTFILPLLRSGKNVVLDRYWWSTQVYSYFHNSDMEIINNFIELEKKAWEEYYYPDLLFLIVSDKPYKKVEFLNKWPKLDIAYRAMIQREVKNNKKENNIFYLINNNDEKESFFKSVKKIITLEIKE